MMTCLVLLSKLRSRKIALPAWVYEIEMGKIFAFNSEESTFLLIEAKNFPLSILVL